MMAVVMRPIMREHTCEVKQHPPKRAALFADSTPGRTLQRERRRRPVRLLSLKAAVFLGFRARRAAAPPAEWCLLKAAAYPSLPF
jgi:hypothetical protein